MISKSSSERISMMTSQDSTAGDTLGENHVTDVIHTSPARIQRMNAYEEVEELHAFGHRRFK